MKYQKFYLPVIWLLYTLITGCAEVKDAMDYAHIGPAAPTQAKTYVYECTDNFVFTTNIENNKAWLFLPDETLELPHVFSTTDAKFSAKQTTLWINAGEATLERDAVVHTGCRNNSAKAIWEHAKLNGVDFRAIGHEPSWVLETVKGETIIFATFYETISTYKFTQHEPEVNPKLDQTVYRTENRAHALLVTITGTPCSDSMSGESFDSTVTVKLDGKIFNGCGRHLH